MVSSNVKENTDGIKLRFKAVILTALEKECNALKTCFQFQDIIPLSFQPTMDTFWKGTIETERCIWEVYYGVTGQKNVASAQATERILQFFRNDGFPDIALFLGVARGMKDVDIGDVAISSLVLYYESGKFDDRRWYPRPDDYRSSKKMESIAKEIIREHKWVERIHDGREKIPQALLGPIVSGEKVVGEIDETDFEWIKGSATHAIALEMEAYGFSKTLHEYAIPDRLIIRGISDLGGGKSKVDASGSQELAAAHAAAFAYEVLKKYTEIRIPEIRSMSPESCILSTPPNRSPEMSPSHPAVQTPVTSTCSIDDDWLNSLVVPTFSSKIELYPTAGFFGRTRLYKKINQHFAYELKNIYVISAGKGFGKTYLACCGRDRIKNFAGIFICDTSYAFTCQPINWINTIIKTLAIQHPSFKEQFQNISKQPEVLSTKNPVSYFNEFFNHLSLPVDLKEEYFVFILDGLDEAEARMSGEYGYHHLLEEINPPSFLKILVTRRYGKDLHSVYNRITRVNHHFNSEENQKDLKDYVEKRIIDIIGKRSLSPEFEKKLLEQLKSKSSGNFLYASLVLDDVENGFDFQEENLPQGLDKLYNKMFENRFSPVIPSGHICDYQTEIKPILAILCTNNRIPRKLLTHVTHDDAFKLLRQFLNEYAYGTPDEYEYELFHESFRTWIRTNAEPPYKISVDEVSHQHQRIADLCEKILADSPMFPKKIQDYARKNVVFHHLESHNNVNYQRALALFKMPKYVLSRCQHNEIYELIYDIQKHLHLCPAEKDSADLLRFLISRLSVLLKYPSIIPQEIKNFGPAFLGDALIISKPWLNLENKYSLPYIKKFDEHGRTIPKIRVVDELLFTAGGNPPSKYVSIWDINKGKYSRYHLDNLNISYYDEKPSERIVASSFAEPGNSSGSPHAKAGPKESMNFDDEDDIWKTAPHSRALRSIEVMKCKSPESSYRIYLGCLHNTIKSFNYSGMTGQISGHHEVYIEPVSHPLAEAGDEISITDLRIMPNSKIIVCRGTATRKNFSSVIAPPQPCSYSVILTLDTNQQEIIDTIVIESQVSCIGVTNNMLLFGCENGVIGTCVVNGETGQFSPESLRQKPLHGARVNSINVNGLIVESSGADGKIIKWFSDYMVQISHYDLTWTRARHAEKMAGDATSTEIFCSSRIQFKGNNLLFIGTNGVIIIERETPGSEGNFEFLQSIHAHAKAVTNLSQYGDFLISSSNDETIKLWSLKDILEVRRISGSGQQFSRKVDLIEFSPDGKYCYFASSPMLKNSFVKVWDLNSGQPQFIKDMAGKNSITSLKSLGSNTIVVCEQYGIIRLGNFITEDRLSPIDNTCSASYLDILHQDNRDLICCGTTSCTVRIIDPEKDILHNVQEFYPRNVTGNRFGNERIAVLFNQKGEIRYLGNSSHFLRDIKTYRSAGYNHIAFCTEERAEPRGTLKIFNFERSSKEFETYFDSAVEKIYPLAETGVVLIIFNEGSIGILHVASHKFLKIESIIVDLLATLTLNTNALIVFTLQQRKPGVPFEFMETLIETDQYGDMTIHQNPTELHTNCNITVIAAFLEENERYLVTADTNKNVIVWRKTPGGYEEISRFVCESELSSIKYLNYHNRRRLICGGDDGRIYFIALENFGGVSR